VQVKPIAVSDILGLPKGASGDTAAVTAVQQFLNSVVSAAGYGPSPLQQAEELKSSVSKVGPGGAGGSVCVWGGGDVGGTGARPGGGGGVI
jgi:hypothetical protein